MKQTLGTTPTSKTHKPPRNTRFGPFIRAQSFTKHPNQRQNTNKPPWSLLDLLIFCPVVDQTILRLDMTCGLATYRGQMLACFLLGHHRSGSAGVTDFGHDGDACRPSILACSLFAAHLYIFLVLLKPLSVDPVHLHRSKAQSHAVVSPRTVHSHTPPSACRRNSVTWHWFGLSYLASINVAPSTHVALNNHSINRL